MAGTDYNRTSNGSVLPIPVSREIIAKARDNSLVMAKAKQKTLTDGAAAVTISEGVSGSKFVGETERKPLGQADWSEKVLRAKKIALVLSFSTEFKRDKRALFQALVNDMPKDLGGTYDAAVLHGLGAPATEFDTFAASPSVSLASTPYANLLTAVGTVAAAGGDVTELDVSVQGEIALLGAVDAQDKPIFTAGVQSGQVGYVLGRPVVKHRNLYVPAVAADSEAVPPVAAAPETLGFAVDWDSMFWGMVEAISYREYDGPIFDDQGDLIHAGAQDNMFSVICEVEAGFRSLDVNRAVRLTGADAA